MRFAFRSIASYADAPQNNYLLLRLVAALLVIYGHSYAIAHIPRQFDLIQRNLHFTYSGAVGVDIFFVISGFLVTGSYLNRRDWADFMKSRCLRIFPGLMVCMLATVFLLGPVVTSMPALQYLTDPQLYGFLMENLTLTSLHFRLPGVFEHLPVDSVNGSLWTLPAEFGLYLLLGIFGAAGTLFDRRGYLPFILLMCGVLVALHLEIHYFESKERYLPLVFLFATGSLIRVYADRIPMSSWILAVLSAITLALVWLRIPYAIYMFWAWVVYATFWFAYVPELHFFNRAGDYSYGLYIYAFPIGQTLRQYLPQIHPLQLFPLVSLLTLGCAMLSWHFIEHPALRLKKVKFGDLIRRRVATGD
ncbi:MAG TPA: acyltransferase [Gammaproteobacteria bacterium]|nr:acyltransferase [Gammaproteobacteria bacterium]